MTFSYRVPNMDRSDVSQELDIALWHNLRKFEGRNGASERTFARTIMRNKIRDLIKAANRKKRLIDSYCIVFSQLPEGYDLRISDGNNFA